MVPHRLCAVRAVCFAVGDRLAASKLGCGGGLVDLRPIDHPFDASAYGFGGAGRGRADCSAEESALG